MSYLLDTNTCIQLMRHTPGVVERLAKEVPTDCFLSTITTYELYTGVAKCTDPAREQPKVDLLLGTLSELSFDHVAAREAGRLRGLLEKAGEMFGPYDVLLTAQAVTRGLTIATANEREFSRIGGLSWENWET